jgi:tetratricopeptide (TPR) repeat protein
VADTEDEKATNRFIGESESVVQAATVHGGIHYHGASGLQFPPPHQLLAGVAGFVDRSPSLEKLNRLLLSLTNGHPTSVVAAITGPPGVGKTALAMHWAHEVRRQFPHGDLYIDMHGYGGGTPLSVEQALDAFLRSLNIDPEKIPIDLEERAALYRSMLGDKKMLIIIDNVASAKQIRRLLPGSDGCLAIVTSRSSLSSLVAREGATRVILDVLSPEDAIRLLAEIIGDERVESDQDAALSIARLCSYLPIALRVVAERVASQPYTALGEIVRELVSEQTRLDALASESDELTDVRAVFSWSYRILSPEQQKVFRLLGLHTGVDFGSSVAAALVDVAVSTAKQQLRELANVYLVQQLAPDRYRLHDLLRAYSVERSQREESQRERTHAMRRMMSWYLLSADAARRVILPYSHAITVVRPDRIPALTFDNVTDAMDWYEQERLNIISTLQQALDLGQYDIAWKLPVVSDGFFELRSYWLEWVKIHRDGLTAAEAVGDSLGRASNLLCLGDANWRIGVHEVALENYESSAAIARDMHDQWVEGFSLRGSGLIYQEQLRFGQSIDYFTRALAIFRQSGIHRGEGMALLSLGKSFAGLEQFEKSVSYCEAAIEIFRRIGDTWSQAWGILPLAYAYSETRAFEAAERSLREALAIFRQFNDRRSEALVLLSLGTVRSNLGNNVDALQHWTTALEIFEQLEDPHADDARAQILTIEQP